MSTRSGKRIHSSFLDNAAKVDKELVVMSERKVKSTRSKENQESLGVTLFKSKKRNNYVTYPTDDENSVESSDTCDAAVKHRRLTRRNALKEQNIEIPQTENIEIHNNATKQIRVTRRTRKLTEDDLQIEENVESVNKQDSVLVKNVKPKKSKKNKNLHVEDINNVTEPVVVKKNPKKKKGKKSNSLISELTVSDEENIADNINLSPDSFHSALNSPTGKVHVNNHNKSKKYRKISSSSNITNDSLTKKQDKKKEEKKEFTETKDTTDGANESLTETTDSFVFHKGSMVNKTLTFHNSCTENLSDEQVSDKETFHTSKTRKSSIIHATYEKDNVARTPDGVKFNDSKLQKITPNDKNDTSIVKINRTFEMDQDASPHLLNNNRKSGIINTTFEKIDAYLSQNSSEMLSINKLSKQNVVSIQDNLNSLSRLSTKLNSTFDKPSATPNKLNSTFDLVNNITPLCSPNKKRKSTVLNTTFEKDEKTIPKTLEESRKRSSSAQINKNGETTDSNSRNSVLNNTFELENPKESSTFHGNTLNKSTKKNLSLSHFDKDPKIDTTFEKDSNSSLISSDGSKSQDISRITITSDESINQDVKKTDDDISDDSNPDLDQISDDVPSKEVIMNTTPYIIESSMDETLPNAEKSPIKEPVTPLKREGTFTKDTPEVLSTNPAMVGALKMTPNKRMSLPSPGCTPFPVRSSSKGLVTLNVTRSIEKKIGSSLAEPVPRTTRVMFCSPVNDLAVATHQKRKVIKSNLKGSKKSFIFQDYESPVRTGPRKRSYTQNDADSAGAKRKRLTEDMQLSVDRLSRPRTSSASAKFSEPTTPLKKDGTPSKAAAASKVSRTKLPNFAALHQKQFDKMESLDECQKRKLQRAKQLLTPTTAASINSKLKEVQKEAQKPIKEAPKRPDFTSKPSVVTSQKPGYTRFGFKLNLDVNPFSIPSKEPDTKAEERKPKVLVREATMPSMTGATSLRREAAKQIVMREKSFTKKTSLKRTETRSIIKGVRTNRRFELQMKLRNIE